MHKVAGVRAERTAGGGGGGSKSAPFYALNDVQGCGLRVGVGVGSISKNRPLPKVSKN